MFTKSVDPCHLHYLKLHKITCYLSLDVLLKAIEITSKERVPSSIGNYKIGAICFDVSISDKK